LAKASLYPASTMACRLKQVTPSSRKLLKVISRSRCFDGAPLAFANGISFIP
jgi:hypothetical protein